ncbi:MAG: N-acetylmuramoyl-L-alanine amidase, partial [Pikeienuella sp.]
FPEPQMVALEALLVGIVQRWGIDAENVLGHEHVAPGRKVDPGPKFDWARLVRLGLARNALADGS